MFEWFNSREAVAVGSSLADYFEPNSSAAARAGRAGAARPDVQKFLQRAAGEAGSLKLNVFKRAKLLETFKSRLVEHGLDRPAIEELTHLLLMQVSGARPAVSSAPAGTRASGTHAPARRIPGLLAEADALSSKGEHAEAAERLREVIAIDSRHAAARNKLGEVLCRLGRYSAAEQEFRQAIQIQPKRVDARFNLGIALRWRGDFLASETMLRRAARQDPRSAEALVALGHTLSALDRVGEAKVCFEKALRLKPRSASAFCGLAWLKNTEGGFTEAAALLRKALVIDPRCAEAQALLVDLRRMTSEDSEWLDSAERMLKVGLPHMEEARLRFAMGKYFNDLGKYALAFEQYKHANELRKALVVPYDRAARTKFVDDTTRVYSREDVAVAGRGGSDSQQPVFVTGMMRSGTSLVEQIIASHPLAAGAGELEFWNITAHKHPEITRHRQPDAAFAHKLTDSYLKELTRRSSNATRIVDKATANSNYLGLIHSLFPKARIICLRRDPIDTCLSSFFQDFASVASFTLDLSDLAHYYREHYRLIQHWRSVLPKEVFLEVPYAELVADQEGWSRKIIEFIGLPWDSKVLEFDKTERPVLTASNWQVRQKIYSSSVGRWKHYEKFIGPLLELRKLD